MNILERLKKIKEKLYDAESLIKHINKHALVPIKNIRTATRLINERLSKDASGFDSPLWDNLSTDSSSGKLFVLPNIDASMATVFVDINYLSNHKGNEISQTTDYLTDYKGHKPDVSDYKSVDKIKLLIQDGVLLDDVIEFSIKKNIVDEGNHRVEALKQLGYKSAPVTLWDGWDR